MRHNLRVHRFFFGGALFLILLMAVFSTRGLLDWRRMVSQNRLLEQQITSANTEWDTLERRIEKFKSDTREQESMIRRVLGYVRENEFVIEF